MVKKEVKVLATGVFDILHPGHIYYLKQAKKLGSHLTVLVTCDKVAKREKRQPVFNQNERLEMVNSLKIADDAIIGSENNDNCETLKRVRPDIIALGYDQISKQKLKIELKKCYWEGKIIRLKKYQNKDQSTTNIIHTIQNAKFKI